MKNAINWFGVGLKKAYTFYKWLNVVAAFLRHMSNFYDDVKQILGYNEAEKAKEPIKPPGVADTANTANSATNDGKGQSVT